MSRESPPDLLRTAAGLLVRNGKVLMGLRADWKPAWPNHWDAIGGRLEPGETPFEALVREVGEEVGVTVTSTRLLTQVNNAASENGPDSFSSIFAVLKWSGGEPENTSDEHSELRWFSPAELFTLDRLAGHSYPQLAQRAIALSLEHI